MANNYKVKMVDLQNKYKFKIFCSSQMYDDTDLKREVEAIYKAFPKASATGTSANLTGTAAAIMNIDLKGNGGNQLLDLKDGTSTVSGITVTTSNGEITLNGTATANAFLTVDLNNEMTYEDGQTYTMMGFNPVANGNTRIRINSGGTFDNILTNANQNYTFTYATTSDIFTNRIQIRVQSGTTLTNFTIKPMLIKGSVVEDYELYGASVTGDNTIDICGKNLVDIADRSVTFQYIVENVNTKNISGYVTLSLDFVNSGSINGAIRLREYGSNTNLKSVVLEANQSGKRSVSLDVTPYNAISIVFQGTASGYNYNISNVQLEKGSTATTYEPYIGNTYPINLGSTKLKTDDSIQGAKNNWNIVRADGTTEAITDATLITQLNNLRYNAESYEGQTNISQVNSDMPFIFDASAIKDLSNL